MELRPELRFPELDEALVHELTELAGEIDGYAGSDSERQGLVDDFNLKANTELEFGDFQGIYGGQSHETWVRTILSLKAALLRPDLSRQDLIALVRRIINGEGEEHEINFWLALVKANVAHPGVHDLIFFPRGERELTPEQIVDSALSHAATPLPATWGSENA